MTCLRKRHLLIPLLLLISVSIARADLITYDLTNSASRALSSLGTKFVVGCTVLALGIIIAAVITRKK